MGDVGAAIIAGSGFYELAGLEEPREVEVETPFGTRDWKSDCRSDSPE